MSDDPLLPVIQQLENSGEQAVSPKGAIGTYQIMPKTAEGLGYTPDEMYDPVKNREAANKLLGQLRTQFSGNEAAMTVAYNAGPKWADAWLANGNNSSLLPAETQKYLNHYAAVTGNMPGRSSPQEIFQQAQAEGAAAAAKLFQPAPPGEKPPDAWSQFAQARTAGYTWQEIDKAIADGRDEAIQKGWTNEQYDDALGLPHQNDYLTSNFKEPTDKGFLTNVWSTLEAGVQGVERGAKWVDTEVERVVKSPFMSEPVSGAFDVNSASPQYQKTMDNAAGAIRRFTQMYLPDVPGNTYQMPTTTKGMMDLIGWNEFPLAAILGQAVGNGLAAMVALLDGRPKSRDETLGLSWEAFAGLTAFMGGPAKGAAGAGKVLEGEILPPIIPNERKLLDASVAARAAAARQPPIIEGVATHPMAQPVFPALPAPKPGEGPLPPEALHPNNPPPKPAGYQPTAEEYRNNPAFPAITGPKQLPETVAEAMRNRVFDKEGLEDTAQRLMKHFHETGEDPIAAVDRAMTDPELLDKFTAERAPEDVVQEVIDGHRLTANEFIAPAEWEGKEPIHNPAFPNPNFNAAATFDALKSAGYDLRSPLEPTLRDWQSNAELLAEGARRLGADTSGAWRLALSEGTPYPREAIPLPIDVKTIMMRDSELGNFFMDEVKQMFAPQLRSEEALETHLRLNEYGARMALLTQRAVQSLQNFGRAVGRLSVDDRFDYMDAIQTGELDIFKSRHPVLYKLAEFYRKEADRLWVEMEKRGIIDEYKDNYLSQLWRQPKKAGKWLEEYTKAQGSEFFRKQSIFKTYRDGIFIGKLIPASSNPINIMAIGLTGMIRSIETHDLLQAMRANGLLKFKEDFPAGEVPVALSRIDTRIATLDDKEIYAPETVALMFNRYFQTGIMEQSNIFRGIVRFKNLMRMAKLTLSPIHIGLVTLDTYLSGWAKVIRMTAKGDLYHAIPLATMQAVAPPARVAHMFWKGRRMDRQIKGLADYGPETQDLARKVVMGGPGFGPTDFDVGTPEGSFWKSILAYNYDFAGKGDEGPMRLHQELKMMWDEAHLGVENHIVPAMKLIIPTFHRAFLTATFGVFEHLVPYMKLGTQADDLRYSLSFRPGATDMDVRKLSSAAARAVEDRMGEVVMKNTAWNKTLQDFINLPFLAFSFVLGNTRALTGGAYMLGKDIIKGGGIRIAGAKEMSYRGSYFVGGVLGVAYLGFMTGVIAGTWNENWGVMDYFNPIIGYDKNGQPEHVTFPGIGRWTQEWVVNPVHELVNEATGMADLLYEFLRNTEYNNAYIAKPHEDLLSKDWDYATHMAYAFRPALLEPQNPNDPTTWSERALGLRRSPSDLYPSLRQQHWEKWNEQERLKIVPEERQK